jgi:hypothetical protein
MIHITHLSKRVFLVIILVLIQTGAQYFDSDPGRLNIFISSLNLIYLEDYFDDDNFTVNESLPIISSTKMNTSTDKPASLSPILKALSTKYISSTGVNSNNSSIFFTNQSTSFSPTTPRKTSVTTAVVAPYMLVSYLVSQFNHYRNTDILSRIKQCDSNLKLHEMCETYSFDNHTYSLIRESDVEFQSLDHLYDALLDRIIVQKLNRLCSIGHWCVANLTQDDIHLTVDVLRQRGYSFCSLDKCHHRLVVHTTTCPSLSMKV